MPLRFLAFSAFCLLSRLLHAQAGCTDPGASNYNPSATTNNGSCVYPVTNYSLSGGASLPGSLSECSGITPASSGFLWTHNDSGGDPEIYKINESTGNIVQTVTVGGATNVDWEEITSDGTHIYVGDFGNNALNRSNLRVYKIPIAAIPSGSTVTVPAGQVQIINFSYESGNYNCEAMILDGGYLHLFTKQGGTTRHYRLSTSAGTRTASHEESYSVGGLITGASKAADGTIALLGYEAAGNSDIFVWLLYGYQSGTYFSGNKRRIELGTWSNYGQTEGICFTGGLHGYISNENAPGVGQQLWEFDFTQILPVELSRFTVRGTAASALLEWETVSEHRNEGFSVERSDDGIRYRTLGFVPGPGDSRALLRYRFQDSEPGGSRYYRLRQRDFGGVEHLTSVVVLSIREHGLNCRIAPNPLLDSQPLELPGVLPDDVQVSLGDEMGRTVWRGEAGQWQPPVLPNGVYRLQLFDARQQKHCASTLLVIKGL